jgi:hypothetical protein
VGTSRTQYPLSIVAPPSIQDFDELWHIEAMKAERDELGFDAPAPLGHPVRASLPTDAPTGPAIGDRLPNFSLPDAFGRVVNFHEDHGESKAALVFYRSAVW